MSSDKGHNDDHASSPTVIARYDHGPIGFRWLRLSRIHWQDGRGRMRVWESAERRTRGPNGQVDGVAIVAKCISKHQAPRIAVISQFRPPVGARCLELPAGLIDSGEDAIEAALRELREETGYRVLPEKTEGAIFASPVIWSDPGMSNANMQYVMVTVDLDDPINQKVTQHLEDGEEIDVELAPWNGLHAWLIERKQSRGWEIDARLMSFALGMCHTMQEVTNVNSSGNDQAAAAAAAKGGGARLEMPLLDVRSEDDGVVAPMAEDNGMKYHEHREYRSIMSLACWLEYLTADTRFFMGCAAGCVLALVLGSHRT